MQKLLKRHHPSLSRTRGVRAARCRVTSALGQGLGAPRRTAGTGATARAAAAPGRAEPPRGRKGFGAPGCGFQKATPDFSIPWLPLLRALRGSLLLAPRVPKVTVSGSSHFCHSLGALVPNLTKYLY